MKKISLYITLAIVFTLVGWFGNTFYNLPKSSNNPISQIKPRPLAKYTIENLSKATYKPGVIELGKILKEDSSYTSYEFSYNFSPDFSNSTKKTSGLINIPKGSGPFPLIVMFRGYVDPKEYFIGEGSQHAGEFFAKNGYITIAPDFLGYADSDKEATNVFESRFQTQVLAISLLKSLNSGVKQPFDFNTISIWAHSNGGQIALTALETTGYTYPTVLWAPVSKPFPFSILYFTDEADDHGKFLRQELAKFEELYDVEDYSLTNFLGQIKASIQINQGTSDESVPLAWSDLLVKNLKSLEVNVEYIKYPGADHNMNPLWTTSINNSLNFLSKHQ